MSRDAAGSRERLLDAAGELFAERGYEGTTVRDIGHRAGVDPAMIARYFGGKAQLYLAALRRDASPASSAPIDLGDADAVTGLLDRVGALRSTSMLYAAVRPHEDADLQAAVVAMLERLLVQPAEKTVRAAGLDQATLRAEIVTAALSGIVLSRTSKAFGTLGRAPAAEVGRLVADLLNGLLQPPATGGDGRT
ncbi:MAG TPA: TetR family transcriptional regulator [Rugosimonospora sp.]